MTRTHVLEVVKFDDETDPLADSPGRRSGATGRRVWL